VTSNYGPVAIESLINYYPTYDILNRALSTSKEKVNRLNIYIDLKNISQAIYLEFMIRYLIEDTVSTGRVSPWIFISFVKYLLYHKKWAIKNDIDIHFYIFFESGSSFYHCNIEKKYKSNRLIDQFYGLSRNDVEIFRDIWQKNLMMIEKVCRRFANTSVIHLKRLEADFVPYYIMTRGLVESGDDILHMTYSTDKDLFQNTFCTQNSIIFRRIKKDLRIVQKEDIISLFAKKEINMNPEWFPIILAITGDDGDCVPQLRKGLGPITATKCAAEVIKLGEGVDQLLDKAYQNQKLFCEYDGVGDKNWNKNTKIVLEEEDAFRRNLNLVSFECLSKNIDNPKTTNWIEIRNFIKLRVDENKNHSDKNLLKEALDKMGIFIEAYEYDILMDEAMVYEERINHI